MILIYYVFECILAIKTPNYFIKYIGDANFVFFLAVR